MIKKSISNDWQHNPNLILYVYKEKGEKFVFKSLYNSIVLKILE